MKRKISIPFKKVVAYLGSSLFALTLFFNMPVYADGGSLSAPFVGWNVHILDIDAEYKQIDRGNYYITPGGVGAYVQGQLNCSSPYNAGGSTVACDIYELESQSGSSTGTTGGLNVSFNIGGLQLKNLTNDEFVGTVYKRIYEVEFILDASYVGSVTFKDGGNSYTDYVNGSKFVHTFWSDAAETFSITISDYKLTRNTIGMWNFPIESFSAVNYLFDDNAYEVTGLQDIPGYMYSYPIFKLPAKGYAARINPMSSTNEGYFIFAVDKDLTESNFFDYFYFGQSEVSFKSLEVVQPYGSGWGVYKVTVTKNGGTLSASIRPNVDMLLMPIYSGTSDNKFLSTEFALAFGLTNDFLDANVYGTQSSNQSVSDQQSEKQNFDNSKDDLFDAEDNMNQNMNDALNNIDTDFNIGTNFGSKFINSADWVKTQFDRVTGNTPFGSVLGFSLLLGVGLLIIGKVLG